jgi:hypothetical protein
MPNEQVFDLYFFWVFSNKAMFQWFEEIMKGKEVPFKKMSLPNIQEKSRDDN